MTDEEMKQMLLSVIDGNKWKGKCNLECDCFGCIGHFCSTHSKKWKEYKLGDPILPHWQYTKGDINDN